MKVYLDVCCLSRLFDDQTQDKIRLETEAIIGVLKRCVDGGWVLIGSDIIGLEISKNPDIVKKQKVLQLHDGSALRIKYNPTIKSRSEQFGKCGVKLFDSLHMASAEYAGADVFLTTDAQLLKASARTDIRIRVENPLSFYLEVLNNEQFGGNL